MLDKKTYGDETEWEMHHFFVVISLLQTQSKSFRNRWTSRYIFVTGVPSGGGAWNLTEFGTIRIIQACMTLWQQKLFEEDQTSIWSRETKIKDFLGLRKRICDYDKAVSIFSGHTLTSIEAIPQIKIWIWALFNIWTYTRCIVAEYGFRQLFISEQWD